MIPFRGYQRFRTDTRDDLWEQRDSLRVRRHSRNYWLKHRELLLSFYSWRHTSKRTNSQEFPCARIRRDNEKNSLGQLAGKIIMRN